MLQFLYKYHCECGSYRKSPHGYFNLKFCKNQISFAFRALCVLSPMRILFWRSEQEVPFLYSLYSFSACVPYPAATVTGSQLPAEPSRAGAHRFGEKMASVCSRQQSWVFQWILAGVGFPHRAFLPWRWEGSPQQRSPSHYSRTARTVCVMQPGVRELTSCYQEVMVCPSLHCPPASLSFFQTLPC